MRDARDEPRVVFVVTPRIALLLLAAIGVAFLLGGWRLQTINENAVHREHMQQAAALTREKGLSAEALHEATVARCEAGNDFRRADLKRWVPILFPYVAVANAPTATPEQRAQVRAFVNNTLTADKLVDCSNP